MNQPEHTQYLRSVAERAAAALGLSVEDVRLSARGPAHVVTLTFDTDISDIPAQDTTSMVEPVDLDTIAEATRLVADALDADDFLGAAPYTLEVSSPGIGRPLSTFSQYRRNVGRRLSVRYRVGGQPPAPDAASDETYTQVSGRLIAVDANQLTLSPDPVRHSPGAKPKAQPERTIALGDIAHAKVDIDFASHEEDN